MRKRLTLFIKGNLDVHDSLHSCRLGGELVWNGINEVLRQSHPGCLARVKHETFTRSDALLRADGVVPSALYERALALGAHPAEIQFSREIFDVKADAMILSIQPDIATGLLRHRREGFLFYPNVTKAWTASDRQWLDTQFEPTGTMDATQSMANIMSIIERIRKRSEAPILVFNMSPITPGEMIHCYQNLGEAFSTRVRRFNLGLIELSEKTGVSIIDLDLLLARKGAENLKLDVMHLTPKANRLVAEEVVRVLDDMGLLEEQ